MLKRLLLSGIFLLVFTGNAGAQIFIVPPPTPKKNIPQYVPDQIIINYKPGNSPQELKATVAQRKEESKNFIVSMKTGLLVLLGKEISITVYEKKLTNIKDAYNKAKVIKKEKLDYPVPGVTIKATIKKGSSLNDAIKIFKALPEVRSADYNYYRFTSRISSEEAPTVVPNKYYVRYKAGETPQALKSKIVAQNNSNISRIAEDIVDGLTGGVTPDKRLEIMQNLFKKVGQKSQKKLFSEESTSALGNTFIAETDGSKSINETIASYESLPEVVEVEPVRYLYTTEAPNDEYYPRQWSLTKIGAESAWNISKGNSIKVAVIDSGVDYNHPDLTGHVVKGPNYFNNNDDPMDDCGHGTHVSGTIGALTNNTIGVAGINWDVTIIAIKALGPLPGRDCGGDDSFALQGIKYAADNGASVINMSLGGPGACPSVFQESINYARNKGVTVVVAAGNNNVDSVNFAPANCQGVINVGATGPDDARASYSNYGSLVSVAAPGGAGTQQCSETTCILSTYIQNGQHGYAPARGTSMAAPHVAGAAALYLSKNPGASPDAVKNAIISNADPISTDRPIGPRLNLAKLMGSNPGGGIPSATPVPSITLQPTPTGTATTTPQPTTSTSPTNPPGTTPTPTTGGGTSGNINISVELPGIGNGPGDNSNPNIKSRKVSILFIDTNGKTVGTSTGDIQFGDNKFSGDISSGNITSGVYQLKIKLENTLYKLIPGFYTINSESIDLPNIIITPGDINNDVILDIFDYNILLSCIKDLCQGNDKILSDLNDDGITNALDLNILLRQFTKRTGD